MMRKSTGTPFKLKGAPFKENGDPEGSTRKTENLGDYATDENHLVNVTKNTLVTPDLAGVDNSGSRNTGKTYKETYGPKQKEKYGSFEAYVKAAEDYWDKKGKGKNDGAKKGEEIVDYETKEKPTPGTPGGTMDSFTAAEGKDLSKLARQTANAAVRDSKKLKKAEDGTFLGRLFNSKTRKKAQQAKKDHQARTIAIRKAEAEAGRQQSLNAGTQQSTGTNTWTTTDKMQDGKGTKGKNFTVAPEGTRRFSDLVNGNNSSESSNSGTSFAELGSKLEDMKKFKLETPTVEGLAKKASGLNYGRNKSATPFKLNKYKK